MDGLTQSYLFKERLLKCEPIGLNRFVVEPRHLEKKRKEKKCMQAAKSSSHQLRKRGHLGRKAPSLEKKRGVSEDQEGCGQTSQQTSPDWFEGGENAQDSVWSEHAYEHSAQNEHGA